jgi:predicted metal-dependent HD superfamily phosphohydrolase
MDQLYQQWRILCDDLLIVPDMAAALGRDLWERYGENGRFYHNLDHLYHVLTTIKAICAPDWPAPALLLAAWYHDAVYDPRAADNEAQSATLARQQLQAAGLARELIDEVARLILLTQKHEVVEAGISSREQENGRILLDADLAILGTPPARYRQYAQAIRQEYAFVPEAQYRQGRTAVLRHLLARRPLYYTPYMQAYSQQARHNLTAELHQWRRID